MYIVLYTYHTYLPQLGTVFLFGCKKKLNLLKNYIKALRI